MAGIAASWTGEGTVVWAKAVFDREGEGGEIVVADDTPKLSFGFEYAGGRPAQRHLAR